jgi:hypothetical protein
MKKFDRRLSHTRIYSLLVGFALLNIFCVQPRISRAAAPVVTISVVNNSAKEIRHLFLASAGSDNWGDDQLSGVITAGTSRNITADWNESTVKIVAEDEDGCFLTTTLDAAGSPSWTITSSTPRNCGN